MKKKCIKEYIDAIYYYHTQVICSKRNDGEYLKSVKTNYCEKRATTLKNTKKTKKNYKRIVYM